MLPNVSSHARQHGIFAKKNLGQNFLFDSNITDKIDSLSAGIAGKDVVEIGPGPAGLTRSILNASPRKLIAIERDQRCQKLLEEVKAEFRQLQVLYDDALNIKIAQLDLNKPKIIANLPYNIATSLLFNWLAELEHITDMTLMFQKEVAERICAVPNCKQYGKLSVMVQLVADTKKLFDVPPSAFTPAPKVTSSVIKIVPKQHNLTAELIAQIAKIVTVAFQSRRKMIKKSLVNYVSDSDWKMLSITSSLRPENFSISDFKIIAAFILNRG